VTEVWYSINVCHIVCDYLDADMYYIKYIVSQWQSNQTTTFKLLYSPNSQMQQTR